MGIRSTGIRVGVNLVAMLWLSSIAITHAQVNITAALANFTRFSVLRDALVSAGLEAEIDGRTTLTLLAPSNVVLNAFLSSNPNADAVRIADLLRFHVLLDYLTLADLRTQSTDNFTSATTLYQATGRAPDEGGVVHIFNTVDNRVLIGPAITNSSSNVSVVAQISEDPFDLSILEVDNVLKPSGFEASADDLIDILESFPDFTLLIQYLKATSVDDILDQRRTSGLTLFAPTDTAFNILGAGTIQGLTPAQQKLLLEFHGLPTFYTLANLQNLRDSPVSTIASTVGGGYRLNITSDGTSVSLTTGVGNATKLLTTLYNGNPLAVYSVDQVLQPTELFGTPEQLSPAEAPAPESAVAPIPSNSTTTPPAQSPPSVPSTPTIPEPGTSPSAASLPHVNAAITALGVLLSLAVAFM